MAFDDSAILDVTVAPADAEVVVSWTSSAPAGTVFHVYQDGFHVWSGAARSAHLPLPPGPVRYQVGAVGPGEDWTNFSGSLPVPPGGGSRITLTWQGGTFLSQQIAGFYVYLGTIPGGAVNYSAPVGKVSAYSQAAITDGWSMGGFSEGSFGFASGRYAWTSGLLRSGTWNAAIVPYDRQGNMGTVMTTSVAVAGPPAPIPRGPDGKRIAYLFRHGTVVPGTGFNEGGWSVGGFGFGGEGEPFATLSWLPSPGI